MGSGIIHPEIGRESGRSRRELGRPAGRPAPSPFPRGKGNADRSGKGDGTKNGPLSHQERDRSGKEARQKWLGDPLTTSVAFLVRSEEGIADDAIFMLSLDIKQQKRDHMCYNQAFLIPTLAFEVSEDEEIIAAPSAPPAAPSAVSSRSSHPIRTQA